ncbi:MAG: M20 family peptidase [Burkholderiales bacterium]
MNALTRIVLAALIAIAAVLAFNTLRLASRQIAVEAAASRGPDPTLAARRLAQAIRFQTVSNQDPAKFDPGAFDGLHRLLVRSFPRIEKALVKQRVGSHSLLYEWRGNDASLKPALLMAHLDVVPADPATLQNWTHRPFSGDIAEGFVWGRGTLDDKGCVMALHEAAEALLGQGFRPRRTLYFAFGHDEEIGGGNGSARIAKLLAKRKVRLESVLDEGQAVTIGIVPGFAKPVALIGIAEKGYLSLELVVEAEGGHSSMPPPHTAVGILSAAVARLERNPFPAKLTPPVRRQFAFLGPEQGPLRKVLFANLWLFAPLIEAQMSKSPSTNALIRTTIAPTMLEGSVKENVLPARARAVVNFRLLPGTSTQEVTRQVRQIVADARVKVAPTGAARSEPSPVSSIDSAPFVQLHRAVKATFPEAIVAPSMVLGATDSRHFVPIADNVFRFKPVRLRREDLKRYHGVNERVAVENYAEFVRFYMNYLREIAG